MASNSKKRRRVLGASCILAALIIASSSFAWFTSKDEVTNRLSASADYGVKIVESFAPPKNWIPGQEVDKDVYATNTGNVGAFVEMDVSGALSIKRDVAVDPTTLTTTTEKTWTVTYSDSGNKTVTLSDADYASKLNSTKTKYCADGYTTGVANGSEYDVVGTPTSVTNTTSSGVFDCVELTDDERYAVEAGAYLAYKPAEDTINKVGDLAVTYKDDDTGYVYKAYKDGTEEQEVVFTEKQTLKDTTQTAGAAEYDADYKKTVEKDGVTYYVKDAEPEKRTPKTSTAAYTDFTPHAEGVYVFRRSIDVDADGFPGDTTGASKGAESFTYDAYYYFGGRYYKVTDLAVTHDDVVDIAGDGIQTDGTLSATTAPTFKLVKEETAYVDPVDLEYDNANHRLIATYNTALTGLNTALTAASQNLDTAEHDYAAAELALRKAIDDAASEDAKVRDLTAARDAAKANRDQAKADYDAKKATFEALKQRYKEALTEFQGADGTSGAKKEVADDIKTLVGNNDGVTIAIGTDSTKSLAENANVVTDDENAHPIGGKAAEYKTAKDAYDAFVTDHTLPLGASEALGTVESIEHIYYTYLQELSADAGNTYTLNPATAFADPAVPTRSELVDEIKKAVSTLTYNQLSNFTAGTETHTYHGLLTAYKLKTDEYEKALQEYLDDVAKLNNIINTLNDASPASPLSTPIATVNTTNSTAAADINSLDATNSQLYTALKEARAALDGYNSTDPVDAAYVTTGGAAKTLADAEQALTNAENALKSGTDNVTGNDKVKENLETAWTNYYKAKNALYAAEQALDAAQEKYDKNGDLTIYINLANDVLVGGVNDKWQVLPTGLVDTNSNGKTDTAKFYYTSIVEGGNTTAKLIDSVELADFVTQDMYKYFDFDLNVAMKSAQVTYDDAGNVLATAVNKNGTFNGELDADVVIAEPAHEATTALTWTAKS